ncbi:hypothetical protein BDW69DRAFT_179000 [Aspergillus filifer]
MPGFKYVLGQDEHIQKGLKAIADRLLIKSCQEFSQQVMHTWIFSWSSYYFDIKLPATNDPYLRIMPLYRPSTTFADSNLDVQLNAALQSLFGATQGVIWQGPIIYNLAPSSTSTHTRSMSLLMRSFASTGVYYSRIVDLKCQYQSDASRRSSEHPWEWSNGKIQALQKPQTVPPLGVEVLPLRSLDHLGCGLFSSSLDLC